MSIVPRQSTKIDSIFDSLLCPDPSCVRHDSVLQFHSKLLVHYSIMTTAMTL
ncbi:MAG: hypothetical protein KZQ60_10835 [Candidatus Thiodiazotropha sp. (ex Lucinoma aequizonata)]|nr:hypothetical protein [Candidatus Thiodiazotropha sp. (ex Lucinoma aequizonata)]